MSDSFRSTPPSQHWSGSNSSGPSAGGGDTHPSGDPDAGEAGKALLFGLLGGLVSAAGYLIYRRLPDEQKERLHQQVRSALAQRINDLRQNFNL